MIVQVFFVLEAQTLNLKQLKHTLYSHKQNQMRFNATTNW